MQRSATVEMRRWMLGGGLASFAVAGCVDPRVIVPADDGTSDTSTSGPPGMTTATTTPAEDTRGTTGSASTTGETTTGEDTGIAFIGPELDMGGLAECDAYVQDCPAGQKCMPWANDGGSSWNSWACRPLAEDPAAVGEPCHVEGSPTSGIDDCALGAMCWDVDPKTGEGECIGLCKGSGDGPYCDDPGEWCHIHADAVLILCVPVCNPLEPSCVEGESCIPTEYEWVCSNDASGDQGAYGDPCEYNNVCDPGLVCLDASAVAGCEAPIGCCTDFCDISDPLGDMQCAGVAEGAICQPWFEPGEAPVGFDDVGVCMLPQ
jgi:hypothetical protein